ncbi:rRNA-processing protein UTP23 homolog isoform X1 [Palaemon carinicauda]|uniref:rRNA-processing protein UTP23 homolog isoform X1 n=1 Tax=Palaemon carinicauda TaxID=392227 RepID=UPI0035B58898
MKIKNQKKTQRILNFYFRNFGVGRPYTVLVDGTFCSAALEARVPIKDQIPIFLDDKKTKIVTTPCIIMEVEKLGKIRTVLYASWLIVKQFAIVKCGHEGKPVPAAQCILSLLKDDNPKKYVVALQDKELKHQIHNSVAGTPIISLNKQAPVLEKPTNKCENIVKESYSSVSQHEEKALQAMKRKYLGEEESDQPQPKKKKNKKKRHLPRKKVRQDQVEERNNEVKTGRRRHRKKRQSNLIKNFLQASTS